MEGVSGLEGAAGAEGAEGLAIATGVGATAGKVGATGIAAAGMEFSADGAGFSAVVGKGACGFSTRVLGSLMMIFVGRVCEEHPVMTSNANNGNK